MTTVLFLAAGRGSRFGGPKPFVRLEPGSEECLLSLNASRASRVFSESVCVVLSPESEFVADVHRLRGFRRVDVRFQLPLAKGDSHLPGGTAYAVLEGWPADASVLVVANGDDLYDEEAWDLARGFISNPRDIGAVVFRAHATVPHEGAVNRAVVRLAEPEPTTMIDIEEVYGIERRGMRLMGFDAAGMPMEVLSDALVSMNLWVFPATFREFLEAAVKRHQAAAEGSVDWRELLIQDVVRAWISATNGRVRTSICEGEWCGLTHPEDLARLSSFVRYAPKHRVLREFSIDWPLLDLFPFDGDSFEAVFDIGGHPTSFILGHSPSAEDAAFEFDLIQRYRTATNSHHFPPNDCLCRVLSRTGQPFVLSEEKVFVLTHKLSGVAPSPTPATEQAAYDLAYRFATFAREIQAPDHDDNVLLLHADPKPSRILVDLASGVPLAVNGLRHYTLLPFDEELRRLLPHLPAHVRQAAAKGYQKGWAGKLPQDCIDALGYLPG